MTQAGEAANRSPCEGIDGEEAANLVKTKQQGTTIVRWTAAQRSEAAALLASVGDEWAAALDRRGKPGSRVLAAARQAREAKR